MTYRAWHMISRPTGMVAPSDFELRTHEMPVLEDGEVDSICAADPEAAVLSARGDVLVNFVPSHIVNPNLEDHGGWARLHTTFAGGATDGPGA